MTASPLRYSMRQSAFNGHNSYQFKREKTLKEGQDLPLHLASFTGPLNEGQLMVASCQADGSAAYQHPCLLRVLVGGAPFWGQVTSPVPTIFALDQTDDI